MIHNTRMWNSIERKDLLNAFRGSDASNRASDQKRWGVPSVGESYQMKCQIIAFHMKMIRLHRYFFYCGILTLFRILILIAPVVLVNIKK